MGLSATTRGVQIKKGTPQAHGSAPAGTRQPLGGLFNNGVSILSNVPRKTFKGPPTSKSYNRHPFVQNGAKLVI